MPGTAVAGRSDGPGGLGAAGGKGEERHSLFCPWALVSVTFYRRLQRTRGSPETRWLSPSSLHKWGHRALGQQWVWGLLVRSEASQGWEILGPILGGRKGSDLVLPVGRGGA